MVPAVEEGSTVDLMALCEGNEALCARVKGLLGVEANTSAALRSVSAGFTSSLPKESLGDFDLIVMLGAGGMGRVFLAEQRSLGRLVALKVIQAREHEQIGRRFRREAEIAAALSQPNIVPVYAIGGESGFSYLAMKWLIGPGLDSIDLPLEPKRVAAIGIAVARALEEAHLSGVVHRDIKPANIILDHDEPIVVDFGLARGKEDQTLT